MIAQILGQAAVLIARPGTWCQNAYRFGPNMRCLVGALRSAIGDGQTMNKCYSRVLLMINDPYTQSECGAELFNDSHTQSECVAMLARAAARAAREDQ